LEKLHIGHQGITKCRRRATQSVWWPGIYKDIEQMISKCSVCSKHKVQHQEPLLPSALPEYPWQKVATDLFEWNNSTYLLVVDYYSRYVELAKLTSTTSTAVQILLNNMILLTLPAALNFPKQMELQNVQCTQ